MPGWQGVAQANGQIESLFVINGLECSAHEPYSTIFQPRLESNLSDRLLGAVKHGPWRMAATPVVNMALSNAYWQRQGLRSITGRYHSVRTS